ncbi:hypothetical protein CORC01_08247 [Colletotrichum orchidophilum]|uniref:Uncharacterized protein n=1 Tax=Colletotrichum orchidophilum TaxID=1209926 RepID=A0A1G4B507_9PEZI|nr:uncharacterized protein CORC01_08247 [Colletotrichum orchidophilum]OHE96484.1 hypothetical protein CORC01_08247 [Colletotrichum orchidophilum]
MAGRINVAFQRYLAMPSIRAMVPPAPRFRTKQPRPLSTTASENKRKAPSELFSSLKTSSGQNARQHLKDLETQPRLTKSPHSVYKTVMTQKVATRDKTLNSPAGRPTIRKKLTSSCQGTLGMAERLKATAATSWKVGTATTILLSLAVYSYCAFLEEAERRRIAAFKRIRNYDDAEPQVSRYSMHCDENAERSRYWYAACI